MDIKTDSYYNSYFFTVNTHNSKIRKRQRLMGTTEERPRMNQRKAGLNKSEM